MKKSAIVILGALLCSASLSGAVKMYNRYGMPLVEKDGVLTIPIARNIINKYGVNPATLENALVPFEAQKPSVFTASSRDIKQEVIVFKKLESGKELRLCVRHASNPKGPAPVFFYIHGGGWTHGAYDGQQALTSTLARDYGVTCVNIEYRLIGKDGDVMMRDIIDDCMDGVNYVIKHAKELKVDSSRLAFSGSSAGGHLSACMAVKFKQTKLLVGCYGPYDLTILGQSGKSARKKAMKDYNPDYMKSVSPQYMVKAPVKFASLLLQGGLDTTVYAESAGNFAAKLKECGAEVADVVIFQYGTHAIPQSMYYEELCVKTLEYVKKYL